MKSGQHEPLGGGEAVVRGDMEGVDCVVPDVVCDDLAAEGNITSPLPSGDTFQLVDEFIEEEREESNDPLEEEGQKDPEEQEDNEDKNEEMEVKDEDVEEVENDNEEEGDVEEVREEDMEEVKEENIEEMKEEDMEVKQEEMGEVMDEDVEEVGENQEEGEYEADGDEGEPAENDVESKEEVKQEQEEEKVGQKRVGKRKQDEAESNAPVRKSSRLRTKLVEDPQQAPADTPRKKMLQKPGERPSKLEEETEEEEEEEKSEEENEGKTVKEGGDEEGDGRLGDPSREPGHDAERRLDPDLLLPFRLGWTRECVFREFKTGPKQIEIYYYPPKNQVLDPGARKKEAIRRRRSKMDQERYFEEFPHPRLSVCNFSYVRRPLGLNNEAYELVRETKSGLETRATRATDKMRESKKSYREVAEHEGLLSSGSGSDGEEEDDDVQDITEFDVGLPLSLQVDCKVTPLREEHKKRRRWPDRERCLTPPLAEDLAWTALDDDPLGVFTKLYDEQVADRLKCPATPPPLRALRLTRSETAEEALKRQGAIRDGLPDPLDRIIAANKELRGAENLASHDLAVRKFKNYRPPQTLGQARPPPTVRKPLVGFGNTGKPQGIPNSRPPPSPLQGYVKVRLPMPSTNGKRPVVELVMLTNGKYQPIKFTNNRQVTESIPKRLFDQANLMKKTLYQRSMQVPKIGSKQVFLAINPTPGGVKPYNSSPSTPTRPQQPSVPQSQAQPQSQQRPVPQTSDQVSILVRPAAGGNAVLLNVPRSVAAKVKQGTTLSFSASNEQKYTVIDNKMHPPVGRQKSASPKPQAANKPSTPSLPTSLIPGRTTALPSLPSGVSIRPVPPGSAARKPYRPFGQSSSRGGMRPSASPHRPTHPPRALSRPVSQPQSARQNFNFAPCSPFCPGVTGIPELECTQCHSLFHPKCVSIPAWQVATIQATFKCKRCAGSAGGKAEVINLD